MPSGHEPENETIDENARRRAKPQREKPPPPPKGATKRWVIGLVALALSGFAAWTWSDISATEAEVGEARQFLETCRREILTLAGQDAGSVVELSGGEVYVVALEAVRTADEEAGSVGPWVRGRARETANQILGSEGRLRPPECDEVAIKVWNMDDVLDA